MHEQTANSYELDLRSVEAARIAALRHRAALRLHLRPVAQPAVLSLESNPFVDKKTRFTSGWPFSFISLGILSGIIAVLIIGLIIPFLPSKVVSPIIQKTSSQATASAAAKRSNTAPGAIQPQHSDRIVINRLGTNAPLTLIGLTPNRSIDTPKTLWQIGHYDKSVDIGAIGTAVLVGHSGAPGQVGVFEHIDQMRLGDIITYRRADGSSVNFRTISSHAYPVNDETARNLVARSSTSAVNLISCYGHWDSKTQEYDQRWIVKAERVE